MPSYWCIIISFASTKGFIITSLELFAISSNAVPPSAICTLPPSASNVISPATSTVKSPELKSISVPSIVILSIATPELITGFCVKVTTPPEDIASASVSEAEPILAASDTTIPPSFNFTLSIVPPPADVFSDIVSTFI